MGTAMIRLPARARLAPVFSRPAAGDALRIDRKCAACEDEDRERIQRSPDPASGHRFGDLAVLAPAAPGATAELSEPGDPAEQEADQVAERVMRMLSAGAPNDAPIALAAAGPAVQRAANEQAPDQPQASSGGFLVDDEAAATLPGQMRKSDFLRTLRPAVCTAADRELLRAGRNTEGCPYLDRWFDYYQGQDAQHVERSLRKYAPETASASSASDYVAPISERVAQGVHRWVDTGEVPELPEGMSPDMLGDGGGVLGALASVGSAIMSGLSAIGSFFGGLFAKGKEGGAAHGADVGAIGARLGEGQPLDGAARSRMGEAFGYDFGAVRVHSDASSSALAEGLNARAFTVGSHIAFGADEYRPGTPMGDALLAHELAHVVQQAGARSPAAVEAPAEHDAVEEDADASAVDAMLALWGPAKTGAGEERAETKPALRSGVQLRRCRGQQTPLPANVGVSTPRGSAPAQPGDVPAPATPPVFASVPRVFDTDAVCGDFTTSMSAQDLVRISLCRNHCDYVNMLSRIASDLGQISSPYAPGIATVLRGLLQQVIQAGPTAIPQRGAPQRYEVRNVTIRVSEQTSVTMPSFTLVLWAEGMINGHALPDGIELFESSEAALKHNLVDVERTVYHEMIHVFSSQLTPNAAGVRGTVTGEPRRELDMSQYEGLRAGYVAAVTPILTAAVAQMTGFNRKNYLGPDGPALAASQMFNVSLSETITRIEEQVFLRLREGRGFPRADVRTLQQPWLYIADYWMPSDPSMQGFIAANHARIDAEVLPAVQRVQEAYLDMRPVS